MYKNNILNFIIFQINWAICVFGAAKGYPWIGPIFVFIWVIIHMYIHRLFILVELPVISTSYAIWLSFSIMDGCFMG